MFSGFNCIYTTWIYIYTVFIVYIMYIFISTYIYIYIHPWFPISSFPRSEQKPLFFVHHDPSRIKWDRSILGLNVTAATRTIGPGFCVWPCLTCVSLYRVGICLLSRITPQEFKPRYVPQVRCLKLLVATDSLNISKRGGEHVFFCSRSKLRSYWCFLVLSPKPHDTSLRWVRIGYIDNDCSTYTPVLSGYSTYLHVENAFVDIYIL